MEDLLIQNITKHVNLTEEEKQIVLNAVISASYKTKTILLKPGMIGDWSYFVKKGILRTYSVDDNGVQHIISFGGPGWWIADMSFLSGKPNTHYIDVVDDTEVYIMSRANQESLYDQVPKMERYFRILFQNSLIAHQNRVLDKLSLTAEERYEHFCEKYPDLKNCLPQKQIASYIGVTPEFFSKMKSKLLRKK